MDKREFLKKSGVAVVGSMMPKIALSQGRPEGTQKNWAGNYTYSTDRLEQPGTVEEVRTAIAGSTHVKALGARHSFNSIADSREEQIQLKHFTSMELDEKAHTVTVGAGVTYGALAPYIDAKGFAVHNLASLPHISVVGACATGTHGSGLKNGNLSTAVRAVEMMTADGKLVTLSKATLGDQFDGAVVGLGALGVITRITLAVQPRFDMTQVVYQHLDFAVLKNNLREIFASGYSVSLFTDWQNHSASEVWIKSRVDGSSPKPAPTFHGATLQTEKLHPIAGTDPINCTDQLGVPGPWYERMPHFKMNFTPSKGQELQTEYFVPFEHGYETIRAVEELRDTITPHLFITELRTIAADDLWMSMAHGRESMAIHFTWKPEWEAVKPILPLIEAKLAPFGPRPHWGKLFTLDPAKIQGQYKQLADFKAMAARYDPKGKFRNDFLNTNVFGA
jgi:xylitol oxidase